MERRAELFAGFWQAVGGRVVRRIRVFFAIC